MVKEELIKEKGVHYYYGILSGYQRNPFDVKTFKYQWVYWYDGMKFLIGKLEGNNDYCMVEVSTWALAVSTYDLLGKKKKDPKDFINKFKEKLEKSGSTIGEVISLYKRRYNLNFDLWQTSFLIV